MTVDRQLPEPNLADQTIRNGCYGSDFPVLALV